MLEEVVDFCDPLLRRDKELSIVDATIGFGGHTLALLSKYINIRHTTHDLYRGGIIHAVDADFQMLEVVRVRLASYSDYFNVQYHNKYFDEFFDELEANSADIILMDLGISMYHLTQAQRGFSFEEEHQLDMRLSSQIECNAYEVVNNYSEEDLVQIFYEYGEERQARKWAKRINAARSVKKIESPRDLCEVLQLGKKKSDKAILSRLFQAIRIEVNQELLRLQKSLPLAWRSLKKDGLLLIISFHSLEDRIAKLFSKQVSGLLKLNSEVPILESDYKVSGCVLTKKPLTPSEKEIGENNASRSAKLRVVKKIV